MFSLKNFISILIFWVLTLFIGYAQTDTEPKLSETGLPFIQNYTPKDYKANGRNFDVVQDSMGILYFANGNGVLMYDGANWEVIELPDQNWVLSIAIDNNNRVYVGGSGEFGYLEPNDVGKLEYVSLSDLMDETQPEFTWIWAIHVTKDAIYFREKDHLFIWANNQFKVINSNNVLDTSFLLDTDLYVNIRDIGLCKWDGEQLRLISQGKIFADKRIGIIVPLSESKILIGTLEEFFIYKNNRVIPFKTGLDDFIKEYKLYSGIKLNNGNIAIASANGGMGVMDEYGHSLLKINEEGSFSSLAMNNLFQDRSGILWASLEYGISKIEYPSPFSIYNQKGINSTCFAIGRFKNSLYVGTENGLYRLATETFKKVSFENVLGIRDGIKSFIVIDKNLLFASDNGLFDLNNNLINKIGNWYPSQLFRSSIDSNRIFVSLGDGIGSVYYQDGKWIVEGIINGIRGTIGRVIEEESGTLWLSGSGNQTYRLSFDSKNLAKQLKDPIIRQFGPEQGLPDDRGVFYKINNGVYFTSKVGKETYKYDSGSDRFKLDNSLKREFGMLDKKVFIQDVDLHGNVFFVQDNDNHPDKFFMAWNTGKGNFLVKDLQEERIVTEIGYSFFVEPKDSVIWHGGANGLVRHDIKQDYLSNTSYNAFIRRVTYKNDSLLAQGVYDSKEFEIPFKNNGFRFQYASTNFVREEINTFQYILEDFDEKWSEWSRETRKDYTNIPEGDYTFKVRAKNVFGEISKVDAYSFTILPPWYRTWWAYLLYGIAGVASIWAFSHWRSSQLRSKNLTLEAVIAERTEEIREKNKKLSYQTERLKELDTMKTRLFANISHEFRTPLTLIKGPVEKLESENMTKISMPNIKMIRRNANRLLNLVNQLLDLSKLDSGKLRLNPGEGDLFKCVRAAASAFGSHAASRHMDYRLKIPSELLWASFDRDKLEKIAYNLLSNAFKFTPDEGRVSLEAEFRSDRLHLKVSDTGSGIATDKLPHIFDRFFQVDDSYTKEKAGSGIGLALTKELVELMGGTIYVESDLGKGTMFRVVIPMEKIETSWKREEVQSVSVTLVEDGAVEPKKVPKKGHGEQLLIIEDNNDMRHFIREQLEHDYAVLEAANGKEGLKMANKIVPDLIVTDLMMPQMDGITLCRELKTNRLTSHIPVVMLTAKAGIENKLEGLETGADEYLTKPFNAKELQVRVANLISQRKLLREKYTKNISLDPKQVAVTSVDEEFLEEVLSVMEENYQESSFGPTQLQKALAMSKTQLHRKLKALTDTPPSELLRNFRLKRAAQLLPQRGDNISQVAYNVGFNSLSYFTKSFKDLYGLSPSHYLKDQG